MTLLNTIALIIGYAAMSLWVICLLMSIIRVLITRYARQRLADRVAMNSAQNPVHYGLADSE